jgi:Contact-dependent growth inhibition CdiA C-terminal domain
MTGRPRGPHGDGHSDSDPDVPRRNDGDDDDSRSSRRQGGPTAVSNIRGHQQSVGQEADLGTPGRGHGAGGGSSTPTRPDGGTDTTPSGTPGGTPDGTAKQPKASDDASTRRSLELENSGASTLAGAGYKIKQGPSADEVAAARAATGDSGDPNKDPDYILEGKVFDAYSPTSPDKPVRGIWWETENKVNKGQTQRVVVNLEDWRGSVSDLQTQFTNYPIPGLKEVKAITPDGRIIQIQLSNP